MRQKLLNQAWQSETPKSVWRQLGSGLGNCPVSSQTLGLPVFTSVSIIQNVGGKYRIHIQQLKCSDSEELHHNNCTQYCSSINK
jgi:hypothetical protein